ncbi:acetoacetate decarboxylase family protein [Xylophilus sp. GW821-FHT01B05]
MPFEFRPGHLYRMPAHFGPTPGPRQGPDGQPFDWSEQPHRSLATVSFLSDAHSLQELLPPGFEIDGEPVVTIEVQHWTQLAWLAGRGYNTLGVKFPVRFTGKQDRAAGHFLAVLWENMPDAILSGREELGYNKIFASIEPPRIQQKAHTFSASWFGHRFVEIDINTEAEAPLGTAPRMPGDGILHFKYIPGTGEGAEPDAAYATLTPPGGKTRITRVQTGQGRARFLPTSWAQMPTQFHIINALAALPQLEWRTAYLVESIGARDLSDQRRLR